MLAPLDLLALPVGQDRRARLAQPAQLALRVQLVLPGHRVMWAAQALQARLDLLARLVQQAPKESKGLKAFRAWPGRLDLRAFRALLDL